MYRYNTQTWTRSHTQFNAALRSSQTRPYGSDTITDTVRYGADVISNASLDFLASSLAPKRSPTQFDTALTSSQTRLSTSSHQPRLRRPVVQCSLLVSDARGRRFDTPLLVPNVRGLMIKTLFRCDLPFFIVCQTQHTDDIL